MPVPPVIQMYRYVMGSGGLGNLLKASEEFQKTVDWVRYPTSSQTPTVTADVPDPNGGSTADQVGFTANTSARLQQTVTLSASTKYTFSVYAKAVSGTVDFRMRNVTLKAAEVKTATTTGGDGKGFTRFTYTFTTTTAGSYELALQNDTNATAKDVIFWGAMLNQGATAGKYVKTDPSFGGSSPTPAYAGFGDSFGGVTAYYSLRQFTEAETLNAIRVRRSSDDTEQDIGFDANGDLDTTALTTFVNADVEKVLNGDFSNGSTNWIISNGSVTGGEYVSGTLSAYQSGIKQVPFAYTGTGTLTFDLTLNSGSLRVEAGTGLILITSSGAQSITLTNPNKLEFNAYNLGFDGIIDNISFIPTNVDGAVTTFYDQSGNGNHATNSTASEQPLVVSGGSVAQFDGINSIEFDGTSHELAASLSLSTTAFSSFSVAGTDGVAGTNAQAIFGSNGTAFYSQIRSYDLETRISSSPILTLDDDIGNNPNQMQLFASINGTSQGNQYIDGTIGNRSPLDTSTSGGISETSVYIGSANGQRYLGGGICEIIIFNSDQSSNRTGIEGNINDYFDIYAP